MGFSSFLTSDTQESIWNVYTGRAETVYMLQPNGLPPIRDDAYLGYLLFGGEDVFVWIAKINKVEGLETDEDYSNAGLKLMYDDTKPNEIYLPKFSFDKDAIYEELPNAEFCPNQGFFSDDNTL